MTTLPRARAPSPYLPFSLTLPSPPTPHHPYALTQAKEMLVDMGFAKGSTGVVIGGATIAGFFAAACSLPFDFVKTQMQKMKPDPVTGAVPYTVR